MPHWARFSGLVKYFPLSLSDAFINEFVHSRNFYCTYFQETQGDGIKSVFSRDSSKRRKTITPLLTGDKL